MKTTLLMLTIASLLIVAVPGQAATASGSGDAGLPLLYGDCVDITTVTADTDFELTSPDGGDWDVFFFDDTGTELAAFQAFGDEAGTVPAGAVSAEACAWSAADPTGTGVGWITGLPGPTSFDYADGADLAA